MIHLIFGVIVAAFYVILSLVFYPIGLLIKLINPKAAKAYAKFYGKIALNSFGFAVGMKMIYRGLDKVVKNEPVLYISNHRSLQDIIATWSILPHPTSYMAKAELLRIPVFGWWVKLSGGVGVERNDHKQAMRSLMKMYDIVREGNCAYIFPEGTRNKNEDPSDLLPFKAGAKKVAQKCKCVVQPIAITHTDCFENHLPKFYREKTVVEFLEPFYYKDLSEDEQKNFDVYCSNAISKVIKKNNKM